MNDFYRIEDIAAMSGLRWSYHYESGMARAILEGPPEAIAALLSHLT